MNPLIHMEERHYKIVAHILSQYPEYQFYAFGSRVIGTHKEFSDLDICSLNDIPRAVISELKERFELSRLPYKVDVIPWARCSAEFQEIIKNDLIKFL